MAKVKLLYFAWVREKIGQGEELVDIPADVEDVAGLIAWLRAKGPEYESAFAQPDTIRAAIDQTHVSHGTTLAGAREVAFFPPVTGG